MSNENLTNPTTDEMARIVYEAITGKCAHGNGQWDKVAGSSFIEGMMYRCKRCNEVYPTSISGPSLPGCPPLATSLDAWPQIWEVMDEEQCTNFDSAIGDILDQDGSFSWQVEAGQLLTAAYNVVKGRE